MGRLSIGEETSTPATPTAGNTLFSTVATPSLLKLVDDSGNVYTLALLEKAQSFLSAQTIAPTGTSVVPLTITMPSGTTARAFRVDYIATEAIRMQAQAALSQLLLISRDLGNNVAGSVVQVGRNSNAGAEGGAAGTVQYITGAGNSRYTWVDGAGDMRVHSAAPTGNSGTPTVSDTAGTVVGSQTSWHELKENIRRNLDIEAMLDAVLNLQLYDFEMGQRRYTGLVIYDRGEWFAENTGPQQVPALNERNLFGYLVGAVQAQQAQIEALTQRLTQLEAK